MPSAAVLSGPVAWPRSPLLVVAACCLAWGGMAAPAQAQNGGALPMYRCVEADGQSSRISRTPCAAGESGSARHAVAGQATQAAPVMGAAAPSTDPTARADEASRSRPRAHGRVGRRR